MMRVRLTLVACLAVALIGSGCRPSNGDDGSVTPTAGEAATTTATSTTTSTSIALSIAIPTALTTEQQQSQARFFEHFVAFGLLDIGACAPLGDVCPVSVSEPLGGPAILPDDADAREFIEAALAEHYNRLLAAQPDLTASRCRLGFETTATEMAWSPGFVANSECGEHLARAIYEQYPNLDLPRLPRPSIGRWYQVPTPSGPGSDTFFDLAESPFGLVAPGITWLWVSQDGVDWTRFAPESVRFDTGGEPAVRVASSDMGLLVVDPYNAIHGGQSPTPTGSNAWFSSDGIVWHESDIRDLLPETDCAHLSIAASPDAFLAIAGRQIWTSINGTSWTGTPVDIGIFGDQWSINSLESTPFGFVAGGNALAEDNTLQPQIWLSADGVNWTRGATLHSASNATLAGIAGSELGVVAVLSSGEVWHSTDTVQWTRNELPDHHTDAWHVAAGASTRGFLAATDGFTGEAGYESNTTVWYSEDGIHWSTVPGGLGDPTFLAMRGIVPLGEGFLIAVEGPSSGGPVLAWEAAP